MPVPLPSLLRRAGAVLVLVVVVATGAGAGGAAAAVGIGRQVPSTDPTVPGPDGSSVPASVPDPVTEASLPPAAPEEASAQDRADADLWAVWQVVMALAAVAVALVVLLVTYVWATSPRRARRWVAGGADDGPADEDLADVDGEADDVPVAAGEDDLEAGADGAGADAPDQEADPDPTVPVPVVVGAEPGPEPEPVAPPRPVPPPPPRSRRPRRVAAPAKKLATPDAERVLVRPGQTPIRVPGAGPGPRSDGPSRSAPPPPSDDPPAPSGPDGPPPGRPGGR